MSTVNLLPTDFIQRRRQYRANVMCLVLFGVVMAAVLTAQGLSELSLRRTRQILDRVTSDYAEAAKLIDQMRQLEAEERVLRSKAERTTSLIERVPRSTILAVVAQALPQQSSLTDLKLEIQHEIKPAKKEPARRTKFNDARARQNADVTSAVVLEITGLTGTDVEVARFIANLARNPLVAWADLVYSKEKTVDDAQVREFQVKVEMTKKADAIDLRQDRQDANCRPGNLAQAKAGESI